MCALCCLHIFSNRPEAHFLLSLFSTVHGKNTELQYWLSSSGMSVDLRPPLQKQIAAAARMSYWLWQWQSLLLRVTFAFHLFPSVAVKMILSALCEQVLFDNRSAHLALTHSQFIPPWTELKEVRSMSPLCSSGEGVTASGCTVNSDGSRRKVLERKIGNW